MFLINTSLAAFATGDLYFVAVAAAATVGVGGVSNLTSLFADIHFILISLISLFKVFIVSIRYLMMYPDNKIRINTNKSIVCICGTLFLFKEGYKKYARHARVRGLPRPHKITRSVNHREYVDDPRIYDDVQFHFVLVDIRHFLASH